MSDNLTEKFKKDLADQGFIATDNELKALIDWQKNSLPSPPVSHGGNLYENLSSDIPDWYLGGESQRRPEPGITGRDVAQNLFEAAGVGLWEYFDIAAFGGPGIVLEHGLGIDPKKKIQEALGLEEATALGKVGKVIGEAAGFLKPMKWVSKGVSWGVKNIPVLNPTGGGKVVRSVIDDAAEFAGSKGFAGDAVKRTLKQEFRAEQTAKAVAHYALSPEAVKASQGILKRNIGKSLQDVFPASQYGERSVAIIDEMTERIVLGLGKPGRHINSVGNWIQKGFRAVSIQDANHISKYVSHAADMTVSFGMYNSLAHGIQAMVGNEEWRPKEQWTHALMFSAVLPLIEALPGGGKVDIYNTAKAVRSQFKIFKKTNYDDPKWTQESLAGLLKVITSNNFLRQRAYGKIAADNAWRPLESMPKEEMVKILKEIQKNANLEKIWGEFAVASGKDFAKGIHRMAAGAAFFNASTIMQMNTLTNVDPSEFGAHMIVGAFFTKMRKPIFSKQMPNMSNFEAKLELMREIGIDVSAAEAWNTYYNKRELYAAAKGGILSEPRMKQLYDVIYNENTKKETMDEASMVKPGERLGEGILEPEFNLLRMSKVLSDSRRAVEAMNNHEAKDLVMIENLSEGRARELQNRLKEIVIDKETGETLTEKNFDDFNIDLQGTYLETGANTMVRSIMEITRRLGIQHEGSSDDFHIDKPGVIKIAGVRGNYDVLGEKYGAIVEYINLLQRFKNDNYIGDFRPVDAKSVSDIMKIKNIESINSEVEGLMRSISADLRKSSFPDGVYVDIDPVNNAWTDLLRTRRNSKDLVDIYNGIKGKDVDMYESFKTIFGENNMPSDTGMINGRVSIERTRPDDVSAEEWARREASIPELESKLVSLARHWAKENRGATDRDIKISYDNARALVTQFEKSHRSIFRYNFADRFNRYYESREFKDQSLSRNEAGLMSLAKEFKVAHEQNEMFVFPWKAAVRDQLEIEGYTEKDIVDKIEKYEKIKTSLARLEGKYISFEDQIRPDSHTAGDLGGFIDNAFALTGESQRQILMDYNKVVEKSKGQAQIVEKVKSIFDNLYDHDSKAFRRMDLKEAKDLLDRVNNLLPVDSGKKAPVQELRLEGWNSLKDTQLHNTLTVLKSTLENWISAYKIGTEFIIGGKQYKAGLGVINDKVRRISSLRNVIEKIVFMGRDTLDGARSAERVKNELIASFVDKLGKKELDITGESTLAEIYDKYNLEKGDRDVDKFISEMNLKIVLEQKTLTKEQYDMMEQQMARDHEILSDNNHQAPKLTWQIIEKRYGEYNHKLSNENWRPFKTKLDEAIELKDGIKEVSAAESILREVHDAIDAKHDMDITKTLPEKMKFNKEFAEVLASAYGTEKVDTIALSENGSLVKGSQIELLIEHKIEADGGFAQFQREWLGERDNRDNSSIDIYKVAYGAVHEGQYYENHADIKKDRSARNAFFEKPDNVLDRSNGMGYRGWRGGKITVSYKDQIYVRTDNIADGTPRAIRFKRKFDEWYDRIASELTGRPLENFKSMFKDWRDVDSIVNRTPIKEIIKNMYWYHLSPEGYKELVSTANDRVRLNDLAVDLIKYFNTMSTVGAKTRGSERFLRTINEIGARQQQNNKFWWDAPGNEWAPISTSINSYLSRGHWRTKSVKDESVAGFNTRATVRKQLESRKSRFAKGSKMHKDLQDQIDLIDKTDVNGEYTEFKSLDSSSINAQTWLGTEAAHITYLQKGFSLFDNIAGVKPVGWSPNSDILLKTNFIYDKNIAELLDLAKIDILTTESASKRFGEGSFELGVKEKDYNSYYEAFNAGLNAMEAAPHGKMKIEDIYFGKANQRKQANVSYGTLNFLDKIGYGAFTKDYINYFKEVDAKLGDLAIIRDPKDIYRNAVFKQTLDIARDEGNIFHDGAAGSMERLAHVGTDVNSILVAPGAERMVVKRILGEMGKMKTEHGSYSVLIPYTEGSVPVYGKNVNGKTKQLLFGGKKLSHEDGKIRIDNWNDVKFIIELTDPKGDGWDIQVGMRGDKLIVNDPHYGNKVGKGREEDIKSLIKEAQSRTDRIGPTYNNLFRALENMGQKTMLNGDKMKLFIHSLSLRIPNIGGDVAVHKIEGFYKPEMGNVTGINSYDLAVIHQADFDVDAVFNHHDMPWKVVDSITQGLGKTPDANIYPPDNMSGVDIFNTGKRLDTVGKGRSEDSLEDLYDGFRNSQRIFATTMNLAPALGSLERLEFKIADGEMMKMSSDEFIPNKQRLKNVLQTVIDATKRTNFVSRASREDVMKYVLFARPFAGSEKLDARLEEFKQNDIDNNAKWSGMFDLSKYTDMKRQIMEDGIISAIDIVNTQNRLLTGVNDASGRRPPDLNQIMHIKNGLESFLSNPNPVIFNDLLWKYRVVDKKRKLKLVGELVNMFYDTKGKSYRDAKALLDDMYRKGKKHPAVHLQRKTIFDLRTDPADYKEGEMNMHLVGVGGIIADRFGTKLNDKASRVTAFKTRDTAFINDILDRFEAAHMLASSESLPDASDFEGTISGYGGTKLFGKYGDMFFKDMESISPNVVQNYSLLYHVLSQRESSLRRFVRENRGSRIKSNSVAKAQYKLNLYGSAKDYFEKKEAQILDSVRATDQKTPMKDHFHFTDINLKGRKGGYWHENATLSPQYIYRINEKGAKVKYQFVTAAPVMQAGIPGKRFLQGGSEYVVLKNPIRYDIMNNRDVQDAFAMLKVTGTALAHNIDGIDPGTVNHFYDRVGALRKDFFDITSETFKMSKASPFAQRNWMDAKAHEDRLISEFFRESLDNSNGSGDAMFTIASIIIKPRATTNMTRISTDNNKVIILPSFKINRRLTLAVERYLAKSNHPEARDVYDSIFGEYGRVYRLMANKIIHPTEEAMYRSDMYANGPLYADRDPLLDFVFDKPGFLYMPAVLQRVRRPLRRHGGRAFNSKDMDGDATKVINYENFSNIETYAEYFSRTRNHEDVVNSKKACY